MKLATLSAAAALAIVVSASVASAQLPGDPGYPVSPGTPQVIVSPPPVIVSAPPVIVARPPLVVVAPPVIVARPPLVIGIGGVYPSYGYYGRPYYGHSYGYGHYHHR